MFRGDVTYLRRRLLGYLMILVVAGFLAGFGLTSGGNW